MPAIISSCAIFYSTEVASIYIYNGTDAVIYVNMNHDINKSNDYKVEINDWYHLTMYEENPADEGAYEFPMGIQFIKVLKGVNEIVIMPEDFKSYFVRNNENRGWVIEIKDEYFR